MAAAVAAVNCKLKLDTDTQQHVLHRFVHYAIVIIMIIILAIIVVKFSAQLGSDRLVFILVLLFLLFGFSISSSLPQSFVGWKWS